MTYDDITEATRQTLADFAESRRVLDLEEINGGTWHRSMEMTQKKED